MPRNGSSIYSLPAGSIVTDGTTIEASQHNTPLNDLVTDANTPRAVVVGGTGATTASGARTNLGLGTSDAVTFDTLTATTSATTAALAATTALTTPSVTNAGTLALSATGANVITASTNGSERLRVDSSGNVGIGTTSPVGKFDVAGTAPTLNIRDTQQKTWAAGDTVGTLDFYVEDTSGTGARAVSRIQSVADVASAAPSGALVFANTGVTGTPTERMRIDSAGNVGIGTASPSATLDVVGTMELNSLPMFACRAWVNFNGTGTVAIRASGNVSSITDNGTGTYTVNFTTAMPDADYAVHANVQRNTSVSMTDTVQVDDGAMSASSVTVRVSGSSANIDADYVYVTVFR